MSWPTSFLEGAAPRAGAAIASARRVALPLALLGCLALMLHTVHGHYAIHTWLLWRFLGYLTASAVFALTCFAAGHVLIRRVFRVSLPLSEHLAIAFAVGMLAFGTTVFLVGLCGGLYWPAFFLIPVFWLAIGARDGLRWTRRLLRHLRYARARSGPVPLSALVVTAAGLLGILMMYVPGMTPANVGYDSQWYHLPIAEHYVARHAIRPFAEGWLPGTSPHLGSLLYTWAFLLPKARLFDHVLICAHLEFVSVLGMLMGVPPLVRRLVRGRRVAGTWVVVWLFPTIFLSDINTGADHFSAVFTLPSFLMLLRAWPRLDARFSALMSVCTAGVILVKYSALPVALIVVGAYVLRAIWVAVARLAKRSDVSLIGPFVALGAGLLVTSQWWLRNWVWYHNPVYPNLPTLFKTSRPWTPHVAEISEAWNQANMWHPTRDWKGVQETLYQVYHFSFQTHDWDFYAGKTPVFGFLFTLSSLALPFVRAGGRTWGLFLAGNAAVFGWYSIHHQERYLQTPLPWFAAATAAFLVHAARAGWLSRVLAGGLVAAQMAWAADLYVIPFHHKWIQPLLDLASSGFRKQVDSRYNIYPGWTALGEDLPKNAVVVIHEHHVHLGIGRQTMSDWVGWQFGLDYGALASPGAVWQRLHGMRATHLAWEHTSRGTDSLGGDLAFFTLAYVHGVAPKTVGSWTVAALPATRPADPPTDVVAFIGCGDWYQSGLYHLRDLQTPVVAHPVYPSPFEPLPAAAEIPRVASYVVFKPGCGSFVPPPGQFRALPTRAGHQLWARTR